MKFLLCIVDQMFLPEVCHCTLVGRHSVWVMPEWLSAQQQLVLPGFCLELALALTLALHRVT